MMFDTVFCGVGKKRGSRSSGNSSRIQLKALDESACRPATLSAVGSVERVPRSRRLLPAKSMGRYLAANKSTTRSGLVTSANLNRWL